MRSIFAPRGAHARESLHPGSSTNPARLLLALTPGYRRATAHVLCTRRPMPRVALVQPPTCDPTAPYLAVPMLTGFLRAHGVEVLPIDANVEAFDDLLEPAPLRALRDRVEDRLRVLDARASLAHREQLELAALLRARGDAHAVPGGIRRA